jgi:uncharacterized phage protein (predicted DNA packaging)
MEIDDIKTYLRIDEDLVDDDELIQSLIDAAVEYIRNQTGKQYTKNDNVWNVCIRLLVAHWYGNRQLNPAKPGNLSEFPHSVSALINHIALCQNYPAVTTS